ncbi:hypothetical protein [Parvibaculum sp. MBR-TMA-1.3b-4.2]|jgi:predicted RNA-binding protein with TRAM domain
MLLVAACGPKLSELPEASVQIYAPDTKDVPKDTLAHIFRTDGEKENALWGSSIATYIPVIDGKHMPVISANTAVPLRPGPHAIVVGYSSPTSNDLVPLRLDAEPGKNYLVLQQHAHYGLENLLPGKDYAPYVCIVDRETGEIVSPKTPGTYGAAEDFYDEPSTGPTASIRGTYRRDGIARVSAYVLTIDGKYVRGEEATLFDPQRPDYASSHRLTPGIHAIGIGTIFANMEGAYAFLLDAKPGQSVVVRIKDTMHFARLGQDKWWVVTVWAEDEKTGQHIIPETDLLMQKLPF